MKRLVVCGDSWMSDCTRYSNTHFTDHVAKTLNYEKISLACQGISNYGICVQIEKAISYKPDLVIIGNTVTDRFDIGIEDTKETVPRIDLNEIYVPCTSEYYNKIENKKVLSGNLSVMENVLPKINQEKYIAFQNYLLHLYNLRLKSHQDHLMLLGSLNYLHTNNIPFLLTFDFAATYTGEKWRDTLWNWVPKKFDMRPFFYNFLRNIHKTNCTTTGYHTSPETQEIISASVIEHIRTYFNQ